MKLRGTLFAAATALLLTAATLPATAAEPFCDPEYTDIGQVRLGTAFPVQHIATMCRGEGQKINVRMDLTGLNSTGTYTFYYYEETQTGQGTVRRQYDGQFDPATARVNLPTYRPQYGGFIRAVLVMNGYYDGTRTVTEYVPITISVPKTASQKRAAKKTRDATVSRAKKALKKRTITKARYKKTVTKAQTKYKRAIQPETAVVNQLRTRQVAQPRQFFNTRTPYNVDF